MYGTSYRILHTDSSTSRNPRLNHFRRFLPATLVESLAAAILSVLLAMVSGESLQNAGLDLVEWTSQTKAILLLPSKVLLLSKIHAMSDVHQELWNHDHNLLRIIYVQSLTWYKSSGYARHPSMKPTNRPTTIPAWSTPPAHLHRWLCSTNLIQWQHLWDFSDVKQNMQYISVRTHVKQSPIITILVPHAALSDTILGNPTARKT